MRKKMMLLASFALAVAAFTVPATASAGWSAHGKHIKTDQTVEFTGFASFDVVGAPVPTTFGCVVHIPVTLTEAKNREDGHVENFIVTTGTCEGTGVLAGCVLKEDEAVGLPWTIQNNTEDLTISGITIINRYAEPCPVNETKLAFAEVTATPDDVHAMSTVALSGTGENEVTEGPVLATGTLAITPAETYGIT